MSTTNEPLRTLLEAVNIATFALSRSSTVPDHVCELVDSLEDRLHANAPQRLEASPYLLSNLFAGAYRAEKALRHDNEDEARRGLRIALEQVRHALRDITENKPFSEETPVKTVLQDLVSVVTVPQREIADVLKVSTRQLQRWLDPDGPTPTGEDESRIRVVAQLANQLRHSFTGPGVLSWLRRTHPVLDVVPEQLLDDPTQYPKLMAAATASRAMVG